MEDEHPLITASRISQPSKEGISLRVSDSMNPLSEPMSDPLGVKTPPSSPAQQSAQSTSEARSPSSVRGPLNFDTTTMVPESPRRKAGIGAAKGAGEAVAQHLDYGSTDGKRSGLGQDGARGIGLEAGTGIQGDRTGRRLAPESGGNNGNSMATTEQANKQRKRGPQQRKRNPLHKGVLQRPPATPSSTFGSGGITGLLFSSVSTPALPAATASASASAPAPAPAIMAQTQRSALQPTEFSFSAQAMMHSIFKPAKLTRPVLESVEGFTPAAHDPLMNPEPRNTTGITIPEGPATADLESREPRRKRNCIRWSKYIPYVWCVMMMLILFGFLPWGIYTLQQSAADTYVQVGNS